MTKTIQINRTGAWLADSEPFLLPDILQLDFNNIGYDLTQSFITFKNGEASEHVKITRPLTVPDSVLFAGKLEMQIDVWHNGEIIKTFYIPPLEIVETDKGVMVFDILAEYEKRLQEQNERIIALENKHKLYK